MIRKTAAGAVVLAALYFLLFGGEYSFLDLWRLEREHETEVQELETIRVEVTELRETADSLATDSAALERLAREQFGLIREGERLYRFVEPDTIDIDIGDRGSAPGDMEGPAPRDGRQERPRR